MTFGNCLIVQRGNTQEKTSNISFLFTSPLQPSSVPLLPLPLSLCLWSGNILPTVHCSLAAHFVWQHQAVDLLVALLAAQPAEPADPITHKKQHNMQHT